MVRRSVFIFIALLQFVSLIAAEESLLPSPTINGVHIITGKNEWPNHEKIISDYYLPGSNVVADKEVTLDPQDFRVGRVRSQKIFSEDQPKTLHPIAHFFYYPDYTEVIDGLNHKTVYRFSKGSIAAVEQYDSQGLYRSEKFFWDENARSSPPKLKNRILEDGAGRIFSACQYDYDDKGRLIKETIAGNLTGNSDEALLLTSDNQLENQGIESYSVRYFYSEKGLLIRRVEDNGKAIEFEYDDAQRCIRKIIRDAQQVHSRYFFYYDAKGLLIKTIVDDAQGVAVEETSKATMRQIIQVTPSHEAHAFGQPLVTESKYFDFSTSQEVLLEKVVCSYSKHGHPIQQEFYDAHGMLRYSLQMQYDDNGKLIKAIDSRGEMTKEPVGEAPKQRYNLHQQQIAVIDKYGNETEYFYDDLGRLSKTLMPSVLDENDHSVRPEIFQDYDVANNITVIQDAKGNITKRKFTARGKPYETIWPDNSSDKTTYFLDGTIEETVANNGSKTVYTRDAFDRVLQARQYAPEGSLIQTVDYIYQGTQLIAATDHGSFTLRFRYDGAGRQIESTHETAEGTKKVETLYDHSGKPERIKEWYGSQPNDFVSKVFERDPWQNIISTRIESSSGVVQKTLTADSSPSPSTVQDDAAKNERGQYVQRLQKISPNGTREVITSDALGRTEKVEVFNSFNIKQKEQHIRYDGNGNKTLERHVVLAHGQPLRTYTLRWRYDLMNRLTDIIEDAGSEFQKNTHYHYGAAGLISQIVKPNGTNLIHQYDSHGRLARLYSSDKTIDYKYEYDSLQRLVKVDDAIHHQTTERHYDAFNNMTQERLGNGLILNRAFDLSSRCICITLPDQTAISHKYEGAFLTAIERLSKGGDILYSHAYLYDDKGRLAANRLIGGLGDITYEYDNKGRFKSANSPWWTESYQYDADNHITQRVAKDPLGSKIYHYLYADDGQLTAEDSAHYESDSLYNRLEGSVNSLNQLTALHGKEYRYDANGNRISVQTDEGLINYAYDAFDRLISVTISDQTKVEYTYDSFHRRLTQSISKEDQVKKDLFLYDGDKELGCVNEEGQIYQLRVLGKGKGAEIGAAVAIEIDGSLYAPIHDGQGSVRSLVDVHTQEIMEFYQFSAFGVESLYDGDGGSIASTSAINPWRYSSKRVDLVTSLIAFGKRYYDPSIGRWLTPDPLSFIDTPNLYAFVRNNPLSNYDLYGHFSISSIWEAICNAASACFNFFRSLAHTLVQSVHSILQLPAHVSNALQAAGQRLLGMDIFSIFHVTLEKTEVGVYGKGEKSDKVRVTFINGLLTLKESLLQNLEMVSRTHGGINVHYVFRPTSGWAVDAPFAALIKMGFAVFGFRSEHAILLAKKWKELIAEMGGVNSGGVIIHYAHSLGGTETDRARELLSPEEQKMIRVNTVGSATMVRNEGFQRVINYVNPIDYVTYADVFGRIRNFFDPNSNIVYIKSHSSNPFAEHPFRCSTYTELIERLGKEFLVEFGL